MATDGRKEIYSIIAERYASAQEHTALSVQEVYDAIRTLIMNDCNQAKVDCIAGFADVYDSMSTISGGFVPAVKALSVYALRSSGAANINAFLQMKNIKVRAAWALLSSLAGFPINEEFIGFYDTGGSGVGHPGLNPSSNLFSSSSSFPFVPVSPFLIAQFGTPFTYPRLGLYDHPLFDYNMVIPYMEWWTDGGSGDPVEMGATIASIVNTAKLTWDQSRPNRDFRWAFWPARFGLQILSQGIHTLFQDPEDSINGVGGVWSARGNAKYRAWSIRFFEKLKTDLVTYGIPDPIYIDPDYEGPRGSTWISDTFQHAYTDFQNDPRYSTELFDGRITFEEFVNNYTDLNGNTVPVEDLLPPVYDNGPDGATRANFSASVGARSVDWALWTTLYEPAKMVFPNVMCGNYITQSASRQYPTYQWRPKESPVDFNTSMWADVGVLGYFGAFAGPIEAPQSWMADTYGFRQYYELVRRYGIDTSKTPNQQLFDMFKGEFAFNATGAVRSAPNKEAAVWLSYNLGNLFLDQSTFPPGAASFDYAGNLEAIKFQMRTMSSLGVKYIGLFDVMDTFLPQYYAFETKPVLDFWLSVVQAMPSCGYNTY